MIQPLLQHLRHEQWSLVELLLGDEDATLSPADVQPFLINRFLAADLVRIEEVYR